MRNNNAINFIIPTGEKHLPSLNKKEAFLVEQYVFLMILLESNTIAKKERLQQTWNNCFLFFKLNIAYLIFSPTRQTPALKSRFEKKMRMPTQASEFILLSIKFIYDDQSQNLNCQCSSQIRLSAYALYSRN